MKILDVRDLPLPGAKLVEYARFRDRRGYFAEIWRRDDFREVARAVGRRDLDFVQANESRSSARVLRGLHLQAVPPMGKLVRLLYGRTLDLALDARPDSPAFGRLMAVDLGFRPDDDRGSWIWLPPGLAHGNLYLADSAIEYLCDAVYDPAGEATLDPFDPDIDRSLCPPAFHEAWRAIALRDPVMSDRDRRGASLAAWRLDPRSWALRGTSQPPDGGSRP